MSSQKPNILWLLTDEQRRDSLGLYGSPWVADHTRHWNSLADRSLVFNHAYTPSPVCVPARVAMLTGYRPSTAGVLSIHDPLNESHADFLTRAFEHAGYQTATFGKQHYNCRHKKAFQTESFRIVGDRVKPLGYVDPRDEADAAVVQYPGEDAASRWVLAGRYPGTLDDTPEAAVARDAIEWLANRDADTPFFLRVSFNGPHTPVTAPPPFDTLVNPASIDLPIDRDLTNRPALPPALEAALIQRSGVHRLSNEQVLRTRQCYYGFVAALDVLVGRVLHALEAAGLRENTIIAFCSDHGTHLGDHGFYQKQSFFEESVRVPFMVAVPGHPPRRIDTPVSTAALLPTLMKVAGIDIPAHCEYAPLASVLDAMADEPDAPVVSEIRYGDRCDRPHDRYVMVRHGSWKLSVFRDRFNPDRLPPNDGMMLFNLDNDPGERTDLVPLLASDASLRITSESLLHDLDQHDRRHAADDRRATPASAS